MLVLLSGPLGPCFYSQLPLSFYEPASSFMDLKFIFPGVVDMSQLIELAALAEVTGSIHITAVAT